MKLYCVIVSAQETAHALVSRDHMQGGVKVAANITHFNGNAYVREFQIIDVL